MVYRREVPANPAEIRPDGGDAYLKHPTAHLNNVRMESGVKKRASNSEG